MCGIISASSREEVDYSAVRLGMLSADDRGGHSCGIAVRDKKGEGNLIRQVSNAKHFVNDKNDDIQIPRKNTSFIGHTRYATAGKKTVVNAHPFSFGGITGVHNGSIDNFKDLKSKYIQSYREDVDRWYGKDWKEGLEVKSRKDIDVENDSKLLYYLIWKKGLPNVLPLLKGTLALVFYKKEEDGEYLYFYRYDKPLCYGYRGDALWIGSLKKYLDTLGCTNIKNVTEHAIYKVKDGRILTSKQQPNDIKPKAKSSYRDDDYDKALEPDREKKSKKETTANRKKSRVANEVAGFLDGRRTNEVIDSDSYELFPPEDEDGERGFRFSAPKSAKGETDKDGKLVLYWFSSSDPYVVYLETEGQDEIDHFDLEEKENRATLRQQYPTVVDSILEDLFQIEATVEYRTKPF